MIPEAEEQLNVGAIILAPGFELFNPELKEEPHPYWGISPRQIAQFMGTEVFREKIQELIPDIGNDFWIKVMYAHMLKIPLDETFHVGYVISDVRFQNEVDLVQKLGGYIFKIDRPGKDGSVGLSNHASEAINRLEWNPETTWLVGNYGTIEELYDSVDRCMDGLEAKKKEGQ